MGYAKEVTETLRKEYSGKKDEAYNYRSVYKQKLIDFRKQKSSVEKIDRPSNIPRARSLGYKAKRGIFVVRVKLRKGAGAHKRPKRGRRPKRMAVKKLTRKISIQGIAEQRAARKCPNADVLNSYWVAESGKSEFYEIIMAERGTPEIKTDKEISKVTGSRPKGRAFRGLTSAQKKSRGLRRKGKGAERIRPSRRAKKRKSK
jgi:large subunit ribosomal protein L15e